MKWFSTSACVKQAGLGILLLFFVTLVTLVFSFLGTIACGALVGMMLGANRQWKWQILLVSLVFPAVIMGFLQYWRNDLPERESILVSIVCFGAFWITYLLTSALLYFEKQPKLQSVQRAQPSPATIEPSPLGHADDDRRERRIIAAPLAVLAEPPGESSLDELQGTWSQVNADVDGQRCKMLIEVAQDELTLSMIGVDGKVHVLSEGHLKIERSGPLKILTVLDPRTQASPVSAELVGKPRAWVYRVHGPTLTMAANFEESVCDGQPVIETYVRTRHRC